MSAPLKKNYANGWNPSWDSIASLRAVLDAYRGFAVGGATDAEVTQQICERFGEMRIRPDSDEEPVPRLCRRAPPRAAEWLRINSVRGGR